MKEMDSTVTFFNLAEAIRDIGDKVKPITCPTLIVMVTEDTVSILSDDKSWTDQFGKHGELFQLVLFNLAMNSRD